MSNLYEVCYLIMIGTASAAAFAIVQFGLMAVVKKGYAYLGYAALITLFIPFVVHVVATKGKEI